MSPGSESRRAGAAARAEPWAASHIAAAWARHHPCQREAAAWVGLNPRRRRSPRSSSAAVRCFSESWPFVVSRCPTAALLLPRPSCVRFHSPSAPHMPVQVGERIAWTQISRPSPAPQGSTGGSALPVCVGDCRGPVDGLRCAQCPSAAPYKYGPKRRRPGPGARCPESERCPATMALSGP